ncbi:MAG: GCN5 family N-acetyltransferase [Bacteroidia bacterium]|nr:MAG: GCN5 family N-acetyltransferase [Bacteroidia bacterium]
MAAPFETVVLEGTYVRLEPLGMHHLEGLCLVGLDPDLWEHATVRIETEADMRKYVHTALQWHIEGTALPFAILERLSQRIVGSTRFANIEPMHKRLEIGWTWIGRPWQRTAVNTETKYLLLRHAFETMQYHRVEFKTDALNHRSRRALLRLGATEEGVLRKHMIVQEGRVRDSVYFSILDSEWPHIKEKLERMIHRRDMPTREPPDVLDLS